MFTQIGQFSTNLLLFIVQNSTGVRHPTHLGVQVYAEITTYYSQAGSNNHEPPTAHFI